MIVNQWVPAAHRGDAIGDSARGVRDLLRSLGHDSEIFAMTVDDDLRDEIRRFDDPAARRGDVTLFHFALPSAMTGAFATLDGGRVLQYHNITPAHFFAPFSPEIFRLAVLGRRELASLVGHVDLALGDSEYNRAELDALGFAPTGVLPIAVDAGRLTRAPRRPALERLLDDGLANFLYVGRIAPNKKIEDHIRLARVHEHRLDGYARKRSRQPRRTAGFRAKDARGRPGIEVMAGSGIDGDGSDVAVGQAGSVEGPAQSVVGAAVDAARGIYGARDPGVRLSYVLSSVVGV